MKKILLNSFLKLVIINFFIGMFLFFIIQYDKNFIVTFFNYLNWLKYFLIGDFGITLGGNKNITLFNFSNELSTIAIGPEYLHTVRGVGYQFFVNPKEDNN